MCYLVSTAHRRTALQPRPSALSQTSGGGVTKVNLCLKFKIRYHLTFKIVFIGLNVRTYTLLKKM